VRASPPGELFHPYYLAKKKSGRGQQLGQRPLYKKIRAGRNPAESLRCVL
jgi:hypothetical protein